MVSEKLIHSTEKNEMGFLLNTISKDGLHMGYRPKCNRLNYKVKRRYYRKIFLEIWVRNNFNKFPKATTSIASKLVISV